MYVSYSSNKYQNEEISLIFEEFFMDFQAVVS